MNEFFLILQRASLFGVAALGIALLLQWILSNRVPARWRVWVWRVALIQTALALIPFAPIAVAILPAKAPIVAPKTIEAPAIQAPIIANAPAVAASPDTENAPVEMAPSAIIQAPTIQRAPVAKPHYLIDINSWDDVAVCIYLLGIALQLALLARNIVRVRRALRACGPLDNAVLRPIAARLKIRRAPRLLQSASGSPFLVGIARPTIVVPHTLDESHLEAVFAHELAHLRRRDLTWNALLWAMQTALWFHPLSWFSRRYHALEVESACDELTLQLTQIAPKLYGALLIGAESSQPSPLTAGVNDGFFALQTRLKRLGRAPMQPRRRVGWILAGALLVSFAAVVPLRLTARAQNETQSATQTRVLSGTVRDYVGTPIIGATVYAMEPMQNGATPLQTATTDANGQFSLRGLKNRPEILVYAGARGMVHYDVYREPDSPLNVRVAPAARTQLRFVDGAGKPINGLKVSLRRAGPSQNLWADIPRPILNAMRGTTNLNGEVSFRALPANFVAQFQLDAPQIKARQLSQIGIDELVSLEAPQTKRTFTIRRTVVLVGHVTSPDGTSAVGTSVMTRRVSAAEAQGVKDALGSAWESYGKPVEVDAKGNYKIENLRPSNYQVWFTPSPKNSNGIEFYKKQTLQSPLERVDAVMPRGGLIQGVVTSQQTGQPIRGKALGLRNSQGSYDYATTDARGYFRFRSLAGAQHLWVPAQGMSAPLEDIDSAKYQFDFNLKVGEKREFVIAVPTKPQVAPIRGVVVGLDGKAVAGAQVVYRNTAEMGSHLNKSVPTDAQGRFALPAEVSDRIVQPNAQGRFALPAEVSDKLVQLFADKAEMTTPYSTFAAPGTSIKLQLAPNAWAIVEGRVLDENKRPLAGISVNMTHFYGRTGLSGDRTKTDKNGAFRYARLRAGTSVWVEAKKSGYSPDRVTDMAPLQPGQTRRLELTLRRAPKTLKGVIYGTDDQPARGYSVAASGSDNAVGTDKNGRFAIPQVLAGPISVAVYGPQQPGLNQWQPVKAMGGDQNVVIRLAKVPRNPSYPRIDRMLRSSVKPETLVGKTAPPLHAVQWSNGRALSLNQLRDKPVFLMFGAFGGNDNEIRDVARSFGERFHFVGVQIQVKGVTSPIFDISADEAARRLGFPVAVDAVVPDKNALGWQTFQSYGQSEYAVIGRDGRVLYAGDKLNRAIELATASSN